MTSASTDRIEKQVVLRAPRARVWRAVTEATEFGAWFGVRMHGPFRPGEPVTANIVEPPGFESYRWEVVVERMEPESYFSFRWHPYAVATGYDYAAEPMTLVEFILDEAPEGTRLTIVESGFDAIPAHRRDEAFRMNEGGWAAQIANVEEYVRRNP